MIRLSTFSGYGLAVVAAAALFWTSQTVQQAQDRLDRAMQTLAQEQESLHVLRAEWDYLNRPERIEALARKYLNMQPAGEESLIADADDIPAPTPIEAESAGSGVVQLAAPGSETEKIAALASIAPGAGVRR